MASTNSPGYSAAQIGLHWLIAAVVLVQLLFGESMVAVVDAAEEGGQASPTDVLLSGVHYWAGIAILGLVALRLVLRLTSGVRAPRPRLAGRVGGDRHALGLLRPAFHGPRQRPRDTLCQR